MCMAVMMRGKRRPCTPSAQRFKMDSPELSPRKAVMSRHAKTHELVVPSPVSSQSALIETEAHNGASVTATMVSSAGRASPASSSSGAGGGGGGGRLALGCGPLLRLDGAVRLAVAADDLCVTLDVPDTVGLCGTLTLAEVCDVWLCVMPRHEVLAMENRSTASEAGERIVQNHPFFARPTVGSVEPAYFDISKLLEYWYMYEIYVLVLSEFIPTD